MFSLLELRHAVSAPSRTRAADFTDEDWDDEDDEEEGEEEDGDDEEDEEDDPETWQVGRRPAATR